MKTKVISAMIVILLGGLLAAGFGGRDDSPPSEAGLVPACALVADGENGYLDFLEIKRVLVVTAAERDLALKETSAGRPSAATLAVIARNAEALRLLGRIASRPHFQSPACRDLKTFAFDTPVPVMHDLVLTGRLGSLRAASLLKMGRVQGALDEALVVLAAGRRLATAREPLIVHLVGILLTDIGSERVLAVAEKGRLSRGQLIKLAHRLSPADESFEGLQEGFRFEYLSMSNTISRLPGDWKELLGTVGGKSWGASLPSLLPRSSFIFKPNRTRGLFARRFRVFIEEAGKPCLHAKVPPLKPARGPLLSANSLGRKLFDVAIPSYEKLYVRRCESDLRLAAGAAAVALKAYRNDKGAGPASLAALVPVYLPEAPMDPFNGELLSYSNGSVHSQGRDLEGKLISP